MAGAVKGRTAGLAGWKSGLQMAALGAVAALITYGVGVLVKGWLGVDVGP